MKKLFVIILICNSLVLSAQQVSKPYDFPIRYGTTGWSNLKTFEERLNAYNVPTNLLKNMSTADLVKTCLNYPELRLIFTRNSLQSGYTYLKTIFNGFQELENRPDAGKELLNAYKQMDPDDINKFNVHTDRGGFTFSFTYIELIISQQNILEKFAQNEEIDCLKSFISNYKKKDYLKEDFALHGLRTSASVMGKIMAKKKYSKFSKTRQTNSQIQPLLSDPSSPIDKNSLDLIVGDAEKFLTNQ